MTNFTAPPLTFVRFVLSTAASFERFAKPSPGHRSGWENGEGLNHTSSHTSRRALRLQARTLVTQRRVLASGEREVHLNRSFHLDRFAIEQIGLVLPLLHGFDRGRSQHGGTADQVQILNIPGLADFALPT